MNYIKILNVFIGGNGPTFDPPTLYDIIGIPGWAFWTILIESIVIVVLLFKLYKPKKKDK